MVLVTVRGVTIPCSLTSAVSEEQQFLPGTWRFYRVPGDLRIVQGNYRNIAYDFESRDNDPNFVFFFPFLGPLVSKGIDGDLSAYIPGKKREVFAFSFIFQIACDYFAVALWLN